MYWCALLPITPGEKPTLDQGLYLLVLPFLKGYMDDFVVVKLTGNEVSIMCKVNKEYNKYVLTNYFTILFLWKVLGTLLH